MTIKNRFAKSLSGTLFLISLFSFSCSSQNNAENPGNSEQLSLIINGTLKSNLADKVYLERMNERNIPTRVDSSKITNDLKFSFNTKVPEPGIYQVNIEGQQVIGLIIDGGENITIEADGEANPDVMPKFTITGAPNIDKFNVVMAEVQNFGKLRQSLEEEFKLALLQMELPDARERANMEENLSRENLDRAFAMQGMSADANYRYAMNQQIMNIQKRGSITTNPLTSPFAWASFIKSIKNGTFTNNAWKKGDYIPKTEGSRDAIFRGSN